MRKWLEWWPLLVFGVFLIVMISLVVSFGVLIWRVPLPT